MSLDSIDMPLFQSGETWTGEGFLWRSLLQRRKRLDLPIRNERVGVVGGTISWVSRRSGISMGVLSRRITITLPNQSVDPNLGTNPPDTSYPWKGESCPDWKSRDLEVAPTKEKVAWICQSGSSSEGTPMEEHAVAFRAARPILQVARCAGYFT